MVRLWSTWSETRVRKIWARLDFSILVLTPLFFEFNALKAAIFRLNVVIAAIFWLNAVIAAIPVKRR